MSSLTAVICSHCGCATEVPFTPAVKVPIYCRRCLDGIPDVAIAIGRTHARFRIPNRRGVVGKKYQHLYDAAYEDERQKLRKSPGPMTQHHGIPPSKARANESARRRRTRMRRMDEDDGEY